MRGKEHGQQINGVDRVHAGSRFRRKLDAVPRFPLFPSYSSSIGNAYAFKVLNVDAQDAAHC